MLNLLAERDVERLRAVLSAFESGRLTQLPDLRPHPEYVREWSWFGKMGGGVVNLYSLPIGPGAPVPIGLSLPVQVIGPAIPAGSWVVVQLEPSSGMYIARAWGRIGLTTSTIGALSGSTPGSGPVSLITISGGVLVSSGTATVYNVFPNAIGNGVYVDLVADAASGQLFVAGCCASPGNVTRCCPGVALPNTLHASVSYSCVGGGGGSATIALTFSTAVCNGQDGWKGGASLTSGCLAGGGFLNLCFGCPTVGQATFFLNYDCQDLGSSVNAQTAACTPLSVVFPTIAPLTGQTCVGQFTQLDITVTT